MPWVWALALILRLSLVLQLSWVLQRFELVAQQLWWVAYSFCSCFSSMRLTSLAQLPLAPVLTRRPAQALRQSLVLASSPQLQASQRQRQLALASALGQVVVEFG